MPAIYTSYVIEPDDTLEEKQAKVYLALISAGETAYTLGAAVAELRKQCDAMNKKIDDIDAEITTLRKEFWKLNAEVIKELNAQRYISPMSTRGESK